MDLSNLKIDCEQKGGGVYVNGVKVERIISIEAEEEKRSVTGQPMQPYILIKYIDDKGVLTEVLEPATNINFIRGEMFEEQTLPATI
jgi:hypothetical protein